MVGYVVLLFISSDIINSLLSMHSRLLLQIKNSIFSMYSSRQISLQFKKAWLESNAGNPSFAAN